MFQKYAVLWCVHLLFGVYLKYPAGVLWWEDSRGVKSPLEYSQILVSDVGLTSRQRKMSLHSRSHRQKTYLELGSSYTFHILIYVKTESRVHNSIFNSLSGKGPKWSWTGEWMKGDSENGGIRTQCWEIEASFRTHAVRLQKKKKNQAKHYHALP